MAGAHLWGADSRVQDAGRRRDRLPFTPSLLLELLAALLLALALSDPRLNQQNDAVHLVAVLDDSASMQAAPPGKPAFRDAAIAELRRRAATAGRDTRLTVLKSGRHPTLIGQRGMTWTDAEATLQSWRPGAALHDFQASWDEAVQLSGRDGLSLFLTDHKPEKDVVLPRGMELLALGEPLNNVAFTAARWEPATNGQPGELYLRIANLGRTATDVTVRGARDSNLVFSQQLTVSGSGEQPLVIPVPAGLGRLNVSLECADDGLAVDNTVQLIEPQPRLVRLAVTLAADSRELRLVQKALSALPEMTLADPADADLIIGDASQLPPSRRGLWWLGIGPLDTSEEARKQSVDLIGPYLLERQHPLLEGITLGGVVWGGVQPTKLRLTPIISVDRTPLLARLEGTDTTAWLMNIDLNRSNLGDSPDWPILFANLIEQRRDALPGLRRWNYRLGESVLLRVPPMREGAESELSLQAPGGRSRVLVRDRQDVVQTHPLDEPGIYRILDGDQVLGEFAVNFFDVKESTLTQLGRDRIEPPVEYEPTRIRLDNPFSWLIVLGILAILLALLLDWYTVGRRSPGLTAPAAP